MSASQRAGKKKQLKVKVSHQQGRPKVVKEKKEVTLDEIFHDSPEQVMRPDSPLKEAEKKATPKPPAIIVDIPKLLRWAARLKMSGNFGAFGNGANFANHMIKDTITVDEQELTIEEASKMISEYTSVQH